MKTIYKIFLAFLLVAPFVTQAQDGGLKISYEKYQLSNGLDVILHVDKSDPIVAVAIQYHVGSNREVPGKTGFAHLFEHMMFQESENIPQDQFFKKIQGAGGTLNGGTNRDGTVYYEIVPKNSLEMVLWMESDRMGYLLNTVTQEAFVNQQNVVQNEKRQNYDNRPYGHMGYVTDRALYPESHPYSWQVIGEMEDLTSATLEDVKEFYRHYYGPNNATLVIAGDIDVNTIKPLVSKYFGEIVSNYPVNDPKPHNISINKTVKLFHEDSFARASRISMVWPVVEQYTPDSYALDVLGSLLSEGKKSPMYKVLVKEKKLTSQVGVYNSSSELTGKFNIGISASDGISLAAVEDAVFEAFDRFEKDKFTDKDLETIKAGLETQFYNGISSILGKSFQLARYNEYAGDPSFIGKDIENLKAVTAEDVWRVYNQYIKGKNYVCVGFVPKGKLDLIPKGAEKANIKEEKIEEASEVKLAVTENVEVIKTPALFDRSVEPTPGPLPKVNIPVFTRKQLADGMMLYVIKNQELPLVRFSLTLDGGQIFEPIEKAGLASILTNMLEEGTAAKTPEELEEAIKMLGANINFNAGKSQIRVNGNCLARNLSKTLDLVAEMLFTPRWDTASLSIIKTKVLNGLKMSKANANARASEAFFKILYGDDNIMGVNGRGTEESVASITMDDLKAYWKKNFSAQLANLHVAGDIDMKNMLALTTRFNGKWPSKVKNVVYPAISTKEHSAKVYFVDIPGAKQSVIMAGCPSVARSHEDYFANTVMNYKLGGSFNGVLNLVLREEKGYTYGARSGFSANKFAGYFTASTSVRSSATLESVQIINDLIAQYRMEVKPEDMEFTKSALIKGNALEFETLNAQVSMLENISEYNLSPDYVLQEEEIVRNMTAEKHLSLARKYLDQDNMIIVVAGDARTQKDALKGLGFGDVQLLND